MKIRKGNPKYFKVKKSENLEDWTFKSVEI